MRRATLTVAALAAASFVLPAVAQEAEPAAGKQQNQQQQAKQPRQTQQLAGKQGDQGGKRDSQPAAFMLVVPVPVSPVEPIPPGAVGVSPRLAPDADAIRDPIADATEAAITPGGFDDVVERLVDADRNRIGAADVDDDILNAASERFRQAWNAKFNREFDIEDESLVYASFPVIQGVISSDAQPASKRFAGNEPEDYNLEAGREVAVVGVPPTSRKDHLPEVLVPMIDELGGWKIDVPNSISGPLLATAVAAQLNALADELPNLQMDEQQAYRHVTHHILLGLMGNTPSTQQNQQTQR